jgi:hypothetical protein
LLFSAAALLELPAFLADAAVRLFNFFTKLPDAKDFVLVG